MNDREQEIRERLPKYKSVAFASPLLMQQAPEDIAYLLKGLDTLRSFIQQIVDDPSMIDSMKESLKQISEGKVISLEEVRKQWDAEHPEESEEKKT